MSKLFDQFVLNNESTVFSSLEKTIETNLFDELSNKTIFEKITNGRYGANLMSTNENNLVPLVRTTTIYQNSIQIFSPMHNKIIDNIKTLSNIANINFNNALIEIYDSKYTNMKYHSDQALDLEYDSFICLYSCYSNPESPHVRKLKIKDKDKDKNTNIEFDYVLKHNTAIIFSVETNKKFLHKIILENSNINDSNKWLGITFRLSKTFIRYKNEIPYFYQSNKELKMATDIEKKEFYKLRSNENASVDFVYPFIEYTICLSDTKF